jgi:hypothetical protein
MMDAREVDIKERISITRTGYSLLKEKLKDDECGWSNNQKAALTNWSVIASTWPPCGRRCF